MVYFYVVNVTGDRLRVFGSIQTRCNGVSFWICIETTKMRLGRAQTSAKAANVTKLLLLNERHITYVNLQCGVCTPAALGIQIF